MNDDDIRDLFKSFEPEISDGDDFIGRLQRNLDSVEMVKARNESFHRSNRVPQWPQWRVLWQAA